MALAEVRRPEVVVDNPPALSFARYVAPIEVSNANVEQWGIKDAKGRPITADATFKRTGIERRFRALPSQTPYDLGINAARQLARPGENFDSVIVSSSYSAGFNQADRLVQDLSIRTGITLEIGGACNGFLAGLIEAYQNPDEYGSKILFGTHELYSKHCADLRKLGIKADPSQAELIFNDLGVATIINRKKLELFKPFSYYEHSDAIQLPKQGKRPGNYWGLKIPESPDHFYQNGQDVIDTIRSVVPGVTEQAVFQAGFRPKDISYVITHQPTIPGLVAASSRLKDYTLISHVGSGNSSSASVPDALKSMMEGTATQALIEGKPVSGNFRLEPYKPFVMVGFGAGFYASAMVAMIHE